MTFDKEYFQQIFGIIMGTNLAPILANLDLAMLQEELDLFGKQQLQFWFKDFFHSFVDLFCC